MVVALAGLPLAALLWACLGDAPEGDGKSAQFLPDELAQRARWEEFLEKAAVVEKESRQMSGSEAVTSPSADEEEA